MRISDWSSDVCSSDLVQVLVGGVGHLHGEVECAAQLYRLHCLRHRGERLVHAVQEGGRLRRQRLRCLWDVRLEVAAGDRTSGVSGKSVSVRVDLGGVRVIKKKKNQKI